MLLEGPFAQLLLAGESCTPTLPSCFSCVLPSPHPFPFTSLSFPLLSCNLSLILFLFLHNYRHDLLSFMKNLKSAWKVSV